MSVKQKNFGPINRLWLAYSARQKTGLLLLVLFLGMMAGPSPHLLMRASAQTVPPGGAADWSQFRGADADGSYPAALPVRWSEQENIDWQIELPGGGSSTPIVWGNHIYLTCYSGYEPGKEGELEELTRHLLCLNAENGRVIWQREIPAKQPEPETIRDHGYAANTGVADQHGVYIFLGISGVHAFDHQGNLRWTKSVGQQTNGWGTGTSLLLHADTLIVNASVEQEEIVALACADGEVRWRLDGIKESWSTPIVAESEAGRSELIIGMFGKVLGVDPDDGEVLWECQSDIQWYMVPTPVMAEGVVYCFGGRSGTSSLAIRLGGNGDVTSSHRLWTSQKGTNVCSPILHEGKLYWTGDQSGIAYCADAETGKILYEERLPRSDQIYASAIRGTNGIYYLDRSGKMFLVACQPEFRLIAENRLAEGGRFNASPAVVAGKLLIRSERKLFCVGNP